MSLPQHPVPSLITVCPPPPPTPACPALTQVGAIIAFLMVWTEFKVIKETSALTFMIAGTVKEVVTGAGRQADWEGGGWEGTQGAGGRREPRYFY